jgi:hypothetical protein
MVAGVTQEVVVDKRYRLSIDPDFLVFGKLQYVLYEAIASAEPGYLWRLPETEDMPHTTIDLIGQRELAIGQRNKKLGGGFVMLNVEVEGFLKMSFHRGMVW